MTVVVDDGPKRVVYLHSRRFQKALKLQGVQHGLAGAIMAQAGVELIQQAEPLSRLLGAFEIAAGVALFVAVAREIRSKVPAGHHAVNSVDVFAAVSLVGEALHRLHRGMRHLPIALAYTGLAAITLLRGLYLSRLLRRRRVELDGDGMLFATRRFGVKSVAWGDVDQIRIDAAAIQINVAGGVAHMIRLADVINADEVREAVREFAGLYAGDALAAGEPAAAVAVLKTGEAAAEALKPGPATP